MFLPEMDEEKEYQKGTKNKKLKEIIFPATITGLISPFGSYSRAISVNIPRLVCVAGESLGRKLIRNGSEFDLRQKIPNKSHCDSSITT